jgi:hypothetical protein
MIGWTWIISKALGCRTTSTTELKIETGSNLGLALHAQGWSLQLSVILPVELLRLPARWQMEVLLEHSRVFDSSNP